MNTQPHHVAGASPALADVITWALRALAILLLAILVMVDGGSVVHGFLKARDAASAAALVGADFVASGTEGPLSQALLNCAEDHGAALVSYQIINASGKPAKVWVQARTVVPLPVLGLIGFDPVTVVASRRAEIPFIEPVESHSAVQSLPCAAVIPS